MHSQPFPSIAVVTGCSRGIGRAIAHRLVHHHFHVVAGVRTPLQYSLPNVKQLPLDLSECESVTAFASAIFDLLPYIDLLVNCAAVCPQHNSTQWSVWNHALQVNCLSHIRITEMLLPLLARSRHFPRVVNISSGDGELLFFSTPLRHRLEACVLVPSIEQLQSELTRIFKDTYHDYAKYGEHASLQVHGNQPIYKLSKAAFNTYTRLRSKLSDARSGKRPSSSSRHVRFIAVCPGDVATDMADPGAQLCPEQAVSDMWTSALHVQTPCLDGAFVRHGLPIQW